jgi:molybdopterin converting factor small subunit
MGSQATIKIQVNYTAPLTKYTNSVREKIELPAGSTIADLIDTLCLSNGPQFSSILVNQETNQLNMSVLVNGQGKNPNYELKQDDEVTFIVYMCGG